MRDYSNIPVLKWNDQASTAKAKLQILHQEPVVLEMPEHYAYEFDGEAAQCKLQEETGIFYDCEPQPILDSLSHLNADPDLKAVADACVESSSRIDIDPNGRRIIVHD